MYSRGVTRINEEDRRNCRKDAIIKILGVWFSNFKMASKIEENWVEKISKMEAKMWVLWG